MNKILKYIFGSTLFSLLLISCGNETAETNGNSMGSSISNYFPSFPNQPFLSLNYGEPLQESQLKLGAQGFTSKPDNPLRFGSEDSTEVILQETEYLSSFKVFFHSKEILSTKSDLEELLTDHAEEVAGQGEFIVYNYKGDYDYKVTQFNQPDFIRLNFELKAAH